MFLSCSQRQAVESRAPWWSDCFLICRGLSASASSPSPTKRNFGRTLKHFVVASPLRRTPLRTSRKYTTNLKTARTLSQLRSHSVRLGLNTLVCAMKLATPISMKGLCETRNSFLAIGLTGTRSLKKLKTMRASMASSWSRLRVTLQHCLRDFKCGLITPFSGGYLQDSDRRNH